MDLVLKSSAFAAVSAVIVVLEHRRRLRVESQIECLEHQAQQHGIQDHQWEPVVTPNAFEQSEPVLREMQAAIIAADDGRVRAMLATMGTRHPDSMILDMGLKPLQLAALVHAQEEEHDRRLKEIMRTLLMRGALITQREELLGTTIMHMLAFQPPRCHIIHRSRFLRNVLDDYLNGKEQIAGLMFDPVLNSADGRIAAVHLLGMRCHHGLLPEDMALAPGRQNMLRRWRLHLPVELRDSSLQDNHLVSL